MSEARGQYVRTTLAPQVLIVDSEQAALHNAMRSARSLGFDVISTRNPLEALDVALSVPRLKAIISDLDMPDLTGPELAERIAAAGLNIPTVFVATRACERLLPTQRQIEKPVRIHELASVLDQLGITVPIWGPRSR